MHRNVVNFKIIFAILSLIVLFISIRAIYISFFMKVQTECAKFVKYDEFIDSNALIIRNEKLIKNNSKYIRALYKDGSKVANNQDIANVYSSSDDLISDSKRKTNEKTKDINIHSINNDINNCIKLLVHKNESNSDLEPMIELKFQIFEHNNDVSNNYKKINNSSLKSYSKLKSEYMGTFLSFTDGFEEFLNLDMDDDEIKNLNIVDYTVPKKQEDAFGKIVLDDKCIILCYIGKDVNLEKSCYYIKFKLNSEEICCDLINTIYCENKKIAIFVSNVNQCLTNSRVESVKIKTNSSQGIKVNKKYIKVQDNQIGVFVLDRRIVKFKLLDPIYENDEFIISNNDGSNDNISENDLIITSGENLYDGKVLTF